MDVLTSLALGSGLLAFVASMAAVIQKFRHIAVHGDETNHSEPKVEHRASQST